ARAGPERIGSQGQVEKTFIADVVVRLFFIRTPEVCLSKIRVRWRGNRKSQVHVLAAGQFGRTGLVKLDRPWFVIRRMHGNVFNANRVRALVQQMSLNSE